MILIKMTDCFLDLKIITTNLSECHQQKKNSFNFKSLQCARNAKT